ncbi:MAG: GAF domain-containing protein [Arthrobacter sp.]|uniref:GAF domain-containing protein n=1 Tax=Arthrobacter sp. TaxID=1667 RepID=UPI00349145FF
MTPAAGENGPQRAGSGPTLPAADAPAVFRAPMRSRRPDVPRGAGTELALGTRVCGMGGAIDPPPRSLEEALDGVADAHGERAAARLERFAVVPEGSFAWTRDADGLYWLGRVRGPWRYDSGAAARDADLVHVRACDWLPEPVAEAEVPAAVRQAFARGGLNFQRVRHPSAAPGTASLGEISRATAPDRRGGRPGHHGPRAP